MPITQDRFVTILNAAGEILEANRAIYDLVNPKVAPAMSELNSLLDHADITTLGQALDVARSISALLQQIHSVVLDTGILASRAAVAIDIEREHFKRYAKHNKRSADYQRQARINKGISPRLEPQGLVHQGLSTTPMIKAPEPILEPNLNVDNDPNYLHLLEHTRAKWRTEQ